MSFYNAGPWRWSCGIALASNEKVVSSHPRFTKYIAYKESKLKRSHQTSGHSRVENQNRSRQNNSFLHFQIFNEKTKTKRLTMKAYFIQQFCIDTCPRIQQLEGLGHFDLGGKERQWPWYFISFTIYDRFFCYTGCLYLR